MKRLKTSDDDVDSYGEKGVCKDMGRRDEDASLHRLSSSFSNRNFYYKSENGRKGGLSSSSSSRYDRLEDERESSKPFKKRLDYDVDSYDRRRSYDRYRDGGEKGVSSASPRGGYGGERVHRSESFSGSKREFPKGFRSERDRSRREGSVSSWWRFSGAKEDEGARSGGESVKANKVAADEVGKVRSPQGVRDAKSPPWSKDSGSEQSKSVEMKKSEEMVVESGSSSEMEEGELEPDPDPDPEPVCVVKSFAEDGDSIWLKSDQNDIDTENKQMEDGVNSLSEENTQIKKVCVSDEETEIRQSKIVQNLVKEADDLPGCQNGSIHQKIDSGDVIETAKDNEECTQEKNKNCKEEVSNVVTEKSGPLEEEHKEGEGRDHEVKAEDNNFPLPTKGVEEGNGASVVALSLLTEEITPNFKDKGKSVAVSPCNGADPAEDGLQLRERDDMEGPSRRGFELFFTDPVKKPDKVDSSGLTKPKDEKLTLEPLELSLSLPNVLLPIGSHNTVQAPNSPSHARSVQSFGSSFRTNSDGFTASMSFSGSQAFSHNPSCSLTHNSFDNYEQSVKSRPLFQGVDWQALSSNDHKNKEAPMYQRMLNGNGIIHHSQAPQGISNGQTGQTMQVQHLKVSEGGSRTPVGLDRQLSLNKQLSGAQSRHLNDVRSPSQSVGSHETGSEYGKDKKRVTREKNESTGGADFVEPIITMLDSEPLHVTAKRFIEMSGQAVAYLKESVREIILNSSKQWQLRAFQKALQNRSDITLDMLLKAHRAQLEILVALKTGLQEYIQRNYDIPSSELAEIFLNLRCRNLTCRSFLPVEECDCKVCVQKNGFCSACMCLVCSKFDMASNTCSWVGCDVCLHWCHVDCALRESYIRNGHSASGAQGTTEMQFHCVACDHPSEMFGFVKEVFQNFSKGWTAEAFSKELEYVRRIFRASEDVRGKRLHEFASQMLSRLANKADLKEVQSYVMGFLTEADSFKSSNNSTVTGKEPPKINQEKGNDSIAEPSQEAMWRKPVYSEKASLLEKPARLHPSFDYDPNNNNHTSNPDMQRSAKKEPVFDELESIVRIKQAEAKMFQSRADDARREAEGLKRIAITKNEKIEEEYKKRLAKLHLAEAEETRREKYEELQALERAHQQYCNMKMRMEADIKDLLLKMEATKRNLTL